MNSLPHFYTTRRSILRKFALLLLVGLFGRGIWLINDEYDILPWELSQSTIDAWKQAGSLHYSAPEEAGNLLIVTEYKDGGGIARRGDQLVSTSYSPGLLPIFHVYYLSDNQFATLPAPEVSFGLKIFASNGTINDKTLRRISGYNKMTALHLESCYNLTDDGLREIASLRKLTYLSIISGCITDDGLKEIASLKRLTHLSIGGRCITDDGLKEIASLNRLTHLSLTYVPITDAGLKYLAPLSRLKMIDLSGTKVTHAGLMELAPLKNLTKLVLNDSQVTDASLKVLRQIGLSHALNLSNLRLDGTHLTDGRLAVLREMGLLHTLPAARTADGKRPANPEEVTNLDLVGTNVTDAGMKELAPLKNLTTLSLSGTQATDAGLKELAPFKTLTRLSFSNTQVTDTALKILREIGLLHALSIASTVNYKQHTTPEEVTRVDLRRTKVTDAGLKELTTFNNLKLLHLQDTPVSDAGLKELTPLKNLTTLYLSGTKVTADGVAELQMALPTCKIIREIVLD